MRGKMIRLRIARPLVGQHPQHLRDDVARALNLNGVADAHIEAGDLVGIVQGRVLHYDAADGDGRELGDRGERTGAADLNLDRVDDGGRLLRGEFVRQRPARRA